MIKMNISILCLISLMLFYNCEEVVKYDDVIDVEKKQLVKRTVNDSLLYLIDNNFFDKKADTFVLSPNIHSIIRSIDRVIQMEELVGEWSLISFMLNDLDGFAFTGYGGEDLVLYKSNSCSFRDFYLKDFQFADTTYLGCWQLTKGNKLIFMSNNYEYFEYYIIGYNTSQLTIAGINHDTHVKKWFFYQRQ